MRLKKLRPTSDSFHNARDRRCAGPDAIRGEGPGDWALNSSQVLKTAEGVHAITSKGVKSCPRAGCREICTSGSDEQGCGNEVMALNH